MHPFFKTSLFDRFCLRGPAFADGYGKMNSSANRNSLLDAIPTSPVRFEDCTPSLLPGLRNWETQLADPTAPRRAENVCEFKK